MAEMSGAELIAMERERQMAHEEWTPQHDDTHTRGQLACGAAVYAFEASMASGALVRESWWAKAWPWDPETHKPMPEDPIRMLVKAGALIAAEIDRLQRAADGEQTGGSDG